MSRHKHYDAIIAGSGVGGATLARELSSHGMKVAVIEKGEYTRDVGTFKRSLAYYDSVFMGVPRQTRDGYIIWRTIMAGGSSMVSFGNAAFPLTDELKKFGIDTTPYHHSIIDELGVIPLPESHLSKGSVQIRESANALGISMEQMPKFIDPGKCSKCGQCSFGCKQEARWSALAFLDQAKELGADLFFNTEVESVIEKGGQAVGFRTRGKADNQITGDKVIIAAGGIGTPIILQKSGIKAGDGLFIDALVNVYGVTKEINQNNEPQMSLVSMDFFKSDGFIISPSFQQRREVRLMEAGPAGFALPAGRAIGLMIKSKDSREGKVWSDGSIEKNLKESDFNRLKKGEEISKEILINCGANPETIVTTKPSGAHPGGTAAIGEVVNSNLMTEIRDLYICDASVLPLTPGLPPIMTIIALGKYLGDTIYSGSALRS